MSADAPDTNTSDDTDASLPRSELLTSVNVRRAAAGDRSSLDWIVKRFSPLLLAQAGYRLGERLRQLYEPEDIVNAVWLKAMPKLGGLAPRAGRLTPVILRYLATSVLNEVSQAYRKHFVGKPPADDGGEGVPDVAADQTGVVSVAIRGERKGIVLQCIEELRESDRELVVLRAIEQRSSAEVSELLEVEPGTLNVRYHRAMKRLRDGIPDSVFAEL